MKHPIVMYVSEQSSRKYNTLITLNSEHLNDLPGLKAKRRNVGESWIHFQPITYKVCKPARGSVIVPQS